MGHLLALMFYWEQGSACSLLLGLARRRRRRGHVDVSVWWG